MSSVSEIRNVHNPTLIAVSVVIPVKNEEKSIGQLLDALLTQTEPPTEIVVVDGGSIDRTVELIRKYIDRGCPVRLCQTKQALPGRGRNVGVNAASCDWIAFIDAGVLPCSDWLAQLRSSIKGNTDIVYGSWEPVIEGVFDECAAIAYVQPPSQIDGRPMRHHFIASSLFKRDVLIALGGFPEHLRSAEDILLMNAADDRGYVVEYAPDAIVRWKLQQNLDGTFCRFRTYARHNIRAGLWSQWQGPIFRRYGFIALLALPAVLFGWLWLTAVGLVWLGQLAARSFVSLWRNRSAYSAPVAEQVVRIPFLMTIIGCLDAATIVGSFDWLVIDKLKLTTGVEDVNPVLSEMSGD